MTRPLGDQVGPSSCQASVKSRSPLPFGVKILPATEVQDAVIADVGATPWARDDIDRRILENTIEGRGHILDSQDEVRGYPKLEETRQAFVPADWDLGTMEPIKPLKHRDPLK